MAEQRTWDLARQMETLWAGNPALSPDWIPFGYRWLECGCLVDGFQGDEIRRPCMAHEGDGHLAALSEQDGMYVARCLVVVCPWEESHLWESDAVSAAQRHWRETRNS